MRRRTIITLSCLSLLLTACSGGKAPAQPSPAPGAPASEAPAWLKEPPVDWVIRQKGEPPVLPRHEQACTPAAGATAPQLEVHLLNAAWTLHPLPEQDRFWTPVATLAVCNVGTPMTAELPLRFQFSGQPALERETSFIVPVLKPGEGLGPLRAFASHGVPEPIGMLWSQEGSRWPELSLTVSSPAMPKPITQPVHRAMNAGPAHAVPGKEAATPDLTAATLPFVAWSQATFGEPAVTISLYAPDARYDVQEAPYCGAPVGAVNAVAKQWAIYISKGSGTPTKALDLGERRFDDRRGIAAPEPRPALSTTFLLLGQYGSCSIPTWYELYAYDHKSGELYRPQMTDDEGKLRPATASEYTLGPDGTLTSQYYINAGRDAGHNTVTYRWDGPDRTWRMLSHTRK